MKKIVSINFLPAPHPEPSNEDYHFSSEPDVTDQEDMSKELSPLFISIRNRLIWHKEV